MRRLKTNEVRKTYSEEDVPSVGKIKGLEHLLVGQDRLIEAIDFASSSSSGLDPLYIRDSSRILSSLNVAELLTEFPRQETTAMDILYASNPDNPNEPKVLEVSPGEGESFALAINDGFIFKTFNAEAMFFQEVLGGQSINPAAQDYLLKLKDARTHVERLELMKPYSQFFSKSSEHIEKLIGLNKDADQSTLDFLKSIHTDLRESLPQGPDYVVNHVVTASQDSPVVILDDPRYKAIFGFIDTLADPQTGGQIQDHRSIKPGYFANAHGGYFVVDLSKMLQQPVIYNEIKEYLKTGGMRIINEYAQPFSPNQPKLRPEPMPLDVKVVVYDALGAAYRQLEAMDPDFRKIFPILCDVDSSMKADKLNVYVKGLKSLEKISGIKLQKSAEAVLLEQSHRIMGHQERFTLNYDRLEEVMKHANHISRKDGRKVITGEDMRKAIEAKNHMTGLLAEKYQAAYDEDGHVKTKVNGYSVGEINGLAVLQADSHCSFGKPITISGLLHPGSKAESGLRCHLGNFSGELMKKAQMDMEARVISTIDELAEIAGENISSRDINLHIHLTYEQSYGMIDGDSASTTETYVVLSLLSGMPLNQGIANTGSLRMKDGDTQAIGGANQKIEGYYEVCNFKGELDGTQGVMIPEDNTKHLMLNPTVMQAVKDNKFNIYAVNNIYEGMQVLTGNIEKDPEEFKKEFAKAIIDNLKTNYVVTPEQKPTA